MAQDESVKHNVLIQARSRKHILIAPQTFGNRVEDSSIAYGSQQQTSEDKRCSEVFI